MENKLDHYEEIDFNYKGDTYQFLIDGKYPSYVDRSQKNLKDEINTFIKR